MNPFFAASLGYVCSIILILLLNYLTPFGIIASGSYTVLTLALFSACVIFISHTLVDKHNSRKAKQAKVDLHKSEAWLHDKNFSKLRNSLSKAFDKLEGASITTHMGREIFIQYETLVKNLLGKVVEATKEVPYIYVRNNKLVIEWLHGSYLAEVALDHDEEAALVTIMDNARVLGYGGCELNEVAAIFINLHPSKVIIHEKLIYKLENPEKEETSSFPCGYVLPQCQPQAYQKYVARMEAARTDKEKREADESYILDSLSEEAIQEQEELAASNDGRLSPKALAIQEAQLDKDRERADKIMASRLTETPEEFEKRCEQDERFCNGLKATQDAGVTWKDGKMKVGSSTISKEHEELTTHSIIPMEERNGLIAEELIGQTSGCLSYTTGRVQRRHNDHSK